MENLLRRMRTSYGITYYYVGWLDLHIERKDPILKLLSRRMRRVLEENETEFYDPQPDSDNSDNDTLMAKARESHPRNNAAMTPTMTAANPGGDSV